MREVVGLVALLGCGRIGFDPQNGSENGLADAPVVSSGLILAFPFDALAAEETFDLVRGISATCFAGMCPSLVTGHIGGALNFAQFDGLDVEWQSAFDTPSAYTIAAWVRPLGTDGSIFTRVANLAVDGVTWRLEQNETLFYFTTTSVVGFDDRTIGNAAVTATWTHIAGVWTGTTKTLYVNGIVDATNGWTEYRAATDRITIGYDYDSQVATNFWEGDIDDVRLYNRALSQSEIQMLANQ